MQFQTVSDTRPMWGRRASVALVVLMIGAGCSSATPVPTPAASDGAVVWPSDTSYGQLFAQVQPDGSVSKDVALEAFSTAIAPLPGVPVAPGGPPRTPSVPTAPSPIDWLMPYMDQLTPNNRQPSTQPLLPSSADLPVHPARPIAEVGAGPASRCRRRRRWHEIPGDDRCRSVNHREQAPPRSARNHSLWLRGPGRGRKGLRERFGLRLPSRVPGLPS